MNRKYIDGHAHINTKYYKQDFQKTLALAKAFNVTKMVMPSTSVASSLKSILLAKKHKNLFASVGIHPADGEKVAECTYLKEINPDDVVAIGEVGIDLYRKTNPPLVIQTQIFEEHIKFAIKNNKVLIIHMRESEQEVYDVLKKYKPSKFIIHSFTSTYDWAMKYIQLGGFISFSGIVTFKNAPQVQDVARRIPLNRILTETDAPFLTPVPHRGKSNQPAYVKYTTNFIASIRNEEDDFVIASIYANTKKLFSI